MAAAFNLTAQLNLQGPTNVGAIVSNIKKQLGSINANVNLNINSATTANVAKLNSSLQKLNATLAQTTTNANQAAQALKNFSSALSSASTTKAPKTINLVSSSLSNAGSTAATVQKLFASSTTQIEEFGRQSALAARRFAAISVVTASIYSLNNAIIRGLKTYIDYNKQLVKLQQVTGESAFGLKALESQISSLSTSLGVSSTELTDVALTLAQAGLSARDTEKALKALALSSLAPSFDNMNETVEGSIALMKQFGISAGELEKSLGAINAVSAAFAVEASDLITAIQRTGGVFATASKGVSEGTDALNEFIAVFTSVRATTRESAETIATGLRTIFTRIQRGGTIDALKQYGVNLTDLDGKFVGAYRAVELLSEGLNRIDPRDIKFSKIVEELGGFRQIGKVIPLIQQFATAQEALKVAQRGGGSLAEDQAVAQRSLANQIAKVREEFLALFREIGSSTTFQVLAKGALSLASSIIKVADSMKELLPIFTAVLAFKGLSALTQFTSGFLGGISSKGGRKAFGGMVQKFASGGSVNMVPVALMPGEAVVYPEAVKKIGVGTLRKMNYADRKPYAKGGQVGMVPGSGRSDSFYTSLPEGSFVIRKDATKAMGYDNIASMVGGRQKFARGGLASLKKLSPGTGKSRIILDNNSDISKRGPLQDKDIALSKITRKPITENQIGDLQKFKDNLYKISTDKRTSLGKSKNNFFAKQGLAFEDWLIKNIPEIQKNYKKAPTSTYPLDLIPKGSLPPAEIKYTNEQVPDPLILNKRLRYNIENKQLVSFSKNIDPNANLGETIVYEIQPGLKDKIYNPKGVKESTKKLRAERKQKQTEKLSSLGFEEFADGGLTRPSSKQMYSLAAYRGGTPYNISSRLINSYLEDPEGFKNKLYTNQRSLGIGINALESKQELDRIYNDVKSHAKTLSGSFSGKQIQPKKLYSTVYGNRLKSIIDQIKNPLNSNNDIMGAIGKTFTIKSLLSSSTSSDTARGFGLENLSSALLKIVPEKMGSAINMERQFAMDEILDDPRYVKKLKGYKPAGSKLSSYEMVESSAGKIRTENEYLFKPGSRFLINNIDDISSRDIEDKLLGGNIRHIENMSISELAGGDIVRRKVGYLDTDIIRAPSNSNIVQPEMQKLGLTSVSEYKMHLSNLAMAARKKLEIKKLIAIAGVAGAGKSTLGLGGARAAQADVATKRQTTRFPILSPSDIPKATEIVDLTSTVTSDKLDSFLKEADRVVMLSASTREEQLEVLRRRGVRDVTGQGLYERKPGSTRSAPIDTGEMEASLLSEIDPKKLAILGVKPGGGLRRKRSEEFPEVISKKIALMQGSFSPMTRGHESMMDLAKKIGVDISDIMYLVGPNEKIDFGDSHSLRTVVFDQDFRTLLAKASVGKRGAMVSKKSPGYSLPKIMEIGRSEQGRRRFVKPIAGSKAIVQGKEEDVLQKYRNQGYDPYNIVDRFEGISGTAARETILSGNLVEAQKMLSPEVYAIVAANLQQLQNRASILPKISENVSKFQQNQLDLITEELSKLPARLTPKIKAANPELALRKEELTKTRDRIKRRREFRPFELMRKLARRYPDRYALKDIASTQMEQGLIEQEVRMRSSKEQSVTAQPLSPILENIKATVPKQIESLSDFNVLKYVKALQAFQVLNGITIPNNPEFGQFAGIKLTNPTQVNKVWRSGSLEDIVKATNMKTEKAMTYVAFREYLISQYLQKQGRMTNEKETVKQEEINQAKHFGLVSLFPIGYSGNKGPLDIGGHSVYIKESGVKEEFRDDILAIQKDIKTAGIRGAKRLSQKTGIPVKKLSEKKQKVTGSSVIEGIYAEQILARLGAQIPKGSKRNRPIDFPNGLGSVSQIFQGIDPTIPTDIKRTINSSSRKRFYQEINKFLNPELEKQKTQETAAIQAFAKGGEVPIMAQAGEYVINKKSAQNIGYNTLDKLNKYHSGGVVGYAGGDKVDPTIIKQAQKSINLSGLNIGGLEGFIKRFISNIKGMENALQASPGLINSLSKSFKSSDTIFQNVVNKSKSANVSIKEFIRAIEQQILVMKASGASYKKVEKAEIALARAREVAAVATTQLAAQQTAAITTYFQKLGMAINNLPVIGKFTKGFGEVGKQLQGELGFFLASAIQLASSQADKFFNKQTESGVRQSAQLETVTSGISGGLAAAGALATINPALGGIAAVGVALYSLADAALDLSGSQEKAAEEFKRSQLAKAAENAGEILSSSFREYEKEPNKPGLQQTVVDQIGVANTATSNKQLADVRALAKEKDVRGFLGFGGVTAKGVLDANEVKAEAARAAQTNVGQRDIATKIIEDQLKAGVDPKNIKASLQDAILESNPDVLFEIFSRTQNMSQQAAQAVRDEILQRERNKGGIIEEINKRVQLQKAVEDAANATRRLTDSFDKISKVTNQAFSRFESEIANAAKKLENQLSSITGQGKVGVGQSLDTMKDILENPAAYNAQDYSRATNTALSVLPKETGDRVRAAAIVNKDIENVISGVTRNVKAGDEPEDIKKAALVAGQNFIDQALAGAPEEIRSDFKNKLQSGLDTITKDIEKEKEQNPGLDTSQAFRDKLSDLAKSMGIADEQIRGLMINSIKAQSVAVEDFTNKLNMSSEALVKARERYFKADDIVSQAAFDIRKVTTGIGVSPDEAVNERNKKVNRLLTGSAGARAAFGNVAPTDIKGIMSVLGTPTIGGQAATGLQAQREALEKRRDELLTKERTDEENKDLENTLKDLSANNAAIRDGTAALEELANSAEAYGAALDDLQKLTQLQAQSIDDTKKVLTSGPEENLKRFRATQRLNMRAAGYDITNTREAQLAATQTFRQTGSRAQANLARQNVLAQQRQEELQTFEAYKPAMMLQMRNQGMNDVDIDNRMRTMEAGLLESFARSQGLQNDPKILGDIARIKLGPDADPATKEAREKTKEAAALQSQANQALGDLNTTQASLIDANNNLIASLNNLTQVISGSSNQANLNQPAQPAPAGMAPIPGVGPPAAPKSKGGIIYASAGQLVNFQPKGTDTVPAMLTPGEFVVNAKATAQHLPLLKAINSGSGTSGAVGLKRGGIVYLVKGGNVIMDASQSQLNEDQEAGLSMVLSGAGPKLASDTTSNIPQPLGSPYFPAVDQPIAMGSSLSEENQALFAILEGKRRQGASRYEVLEDPLTLEERTKWNELVRGRALSKTPNPIDNARRIALSSISRTERSDAQQEELYRLQFQKAYSKDQSISFKEFLTDKKMLN